MADLPTRLDLFDIGRNYVLTRASRIDPETVNIEGSDANLIVGGQSFMAHAVVRQLNDRVNALLLDGASGEDLDRYALDRYQLTRKGASAAVGSVTFSRSSAAAGAGSVPAGTELQSLTGIQFFTTTAATFGAGDLEATADVRAFSAGKEFQVGANQIRTIVNLSALFDGTLSVNNPVRTSGGENPEPDDVFRERIRDFFNTARRGTLDAIEFGAREVAGVESAEAFEVLNVNGNPGRLVELFIADSSGVSNNALAQLVRNSLLEFRAGGITVLVRTSVPEIVDITLSLTFSGNVDTSTLTEAIRQAVIAFVNSLPVNGTLLRADLFSVLNRFKDDGLVVTDNSIATPTGDLVPTTGTTFRVRDGNVQVV